MEPQPAQRNRPTGPQIARPPLTEDEKIIVLRKEQKKLISEEYMRHSCSYITNISESSSGSASENSSTPIVQNWYGISTKQGQTSVDEESDETEEEESSECDSSDEDLFLSLRSCSPVLLQFPFFPIKPTGSVGATHSTCLRHAEDEVLSCSGVGDQHALENDVSPGIFAVEDPWVSASVSFMRSSELELSVWLGARLVCGGLDSSVPVPTLLKSGDADTTTAATHYNAFSTTPQCLAPTSPVGVYLHSPLKNSIGFNNTTSNALSHKNLEVPQSGHVGLSTPLRTDGMKSVVTPGAGEALRGPLARDKTHNMFNPPSNGARARSPCVKCTKTIAAPFPHRLSKPMPLDHPSASPAPAVRPLAGALSRAASKGTSDTPTNTVSHPVPMPALAAVSSEKLKQVPRKETLSAGFLRNSKKMPIQPPRTISQINNINNGAAPSNTFALQHQTPSVNTPTPVKPNVAAQHSGRNKSYELHAGNPGKAPLLPSPPSTKPPLVAAFPSSNVTGAPESKPTAGSAIPAANVPSHAQALLPTTRPEKNHYGVSRDSALASGVDKGGNITRRPDLAMAALHDDHPPGKSKLIMPTTEEYQCKINRKEPQKKDLFKTGEDARAGGGTTVTAAAKVAPDTSPHGGAHEERVGDVLKRKALPTAEIGNQVAVNYDGYRKNDRKRRQRKMARVGVLMEPVVIPKEGNILEFGVVLEHKLNSTVKDMSTCEINTSPVGTHLAQGSGVSSSGSNLNDNADPKGKQSAVMNKSGVMRLRRAPRKREVSRIFEDAVSMSEKTSTQMPECSEKMPNKVSHARSKHAQRRQRYRRRCLMDALTFSQLLFPSSSKDETKTGSSKRRKRSSRRSRRTAMFLEAEIDITDVPVSLSETPVCCGMNNTLHEGASGKILEDNYPPALKPSTRIERRRKPKPLDMSIRKLPLASLAHSSISIELTDTPQGSEVPHTNSPARGKNFSALANDAEEGALGQKSDFMLTAQRSGTQTTNALLNAANAQASCPPKPLVPTVVDPSLLNEKRITTMFEPPGDLSLDTACNLGAPSALSGDHSCQPKAGITLDLEEKQGVIHSENRPLALDVGRASRRRARPLPTVPLQDGVCLPKSMHLPRGHTLRCEAKSKMHSDSRAPSGAATSDSNKAEHCMTQRPHTTEQPRRFSPSSETPVEVLQSTPTPSYPISGWLPLTQTYQTSSTLEVSLPTDSEMKDATTALDSPAICTLARRPHIFQGPSSLFPNLDLQKHSRCAYANSLDKTKMTLPHQRMLSGAQSTGNTPRHDSSDPCDALPMIRRPV